MQVTIDAGSGRKLHNFWNNLHFHPTDAVTDAWGRAILDAVAADRSARYVRLYTMFEDAVTRNEAGKLVFDFSENDRRLDYMVSKGYKLLLCFNFMPICMAADPNNLSGRRYRNKRFCRSAPADYAEWRELCRAQAQHLVARYGIEETSGWQLHCWNEPDLAFWHDANHFHDAEAAGDRSKLTEYCKLYDFFADGVRAASPQLRIGGPSCGHAKSFFRGFLEHVSAGTNYATGETGSPIDFVTMHCYSSIPQDLKDPLRYKIAPESIVAQYDGYLAAMTACGLGDKPIVIDEWAAAAEGYLGTDDDPQMRFRDTEYYAAFYAKLIARFLDRPRPNLDRMMICLSGQDHCRKDFDGHRTFFTAHGYRKPICNAFALAAKLGNLRLDCETEGELPEYAGLIPTRDEEGGCQILLYHCVDDFCARSEGVRFQLRLTGLAGRYRLRHHRIDREHSNAYNQWASLGCPEFPDVWERNQIAEAGQLALAEPETVVAADADGVFSTEILMTGHSVSLLELVRDEA